MDVCYPQHQHAVVFTIKNFPTLLEMREIVLTSSCFLELKQRPCVRCQTEVLIGYLGKPSISGHASSVGKVSTFEESNFKYSKIFQSYVPYPKLWSLEMP